MGGLQVILATSLDGYIAASDGGLGWIIMGDDRAHYMIDSMAPGRIDTLLMGRKTYQGFESYWPLAADDPNAPDADRTIGTRFNAMKKVVFSKTLESADWTGTTIMRSIDPDEIRRLKEEASSGIRLDGSISVVQQMARLGLIDDLRLMVHPVALGSGRPLFEERLELEPVGSEQLGSGVVVLSYRQP